jgi:general secretion pathway protein F
MATYEYVALDLEGRTCQGVIAAATERLARDELQTRRLVPVRIAPAAMGLSGRLRAYLRLGQRRLSVRTLALLTRQLATLVASAPLEEALRTLALQTENPGLRRILTATHAGVLEGFRLSEAMARQDTAFPALYRAMVAAGEQSGALPAVLERMADLLEQDEKVRSRLTVALVYPAALTVTAIGVITALVVYVVPRVVDQFDSMGQRLPLLTRSIIFVSDAARDWGWLFLLLLAGGAAALVHARRRPAFRLRFDAAILRLPVAGRLIRNVNAARLARTLSTMIASGLPVLEGLLLTAPTISNQALRQATLQMAAFIREGGTLSGAMRRAEIFPPILIYMTASGEGSGRVEEMLGRAADYLEREFQSFVSLALSLLEPAIIVIMGAIVTLIVLAILLPILQINTLAFG